MSRIARILGLAIGCVAAAVTPATAADPTRVYVGTYTNTDAKSQGIYLLELDPETGALTSKGLVAETPNPSFLAVHPSRRYLYAVNELDTFEGRKDTGSVSGFKIDLDSGKLAPINQQPSQGAIPCHLVVDPSGRNVLVANYSGGSVSVLPIDLDGKLSPASSTIKHEGPTANPARQPGPRAHSINLDAANRFAVVADLGLDKLFVYKFDPARGQLVPNEPPATFVAPVSGPRHFAFHPNGRFGYAINEIACTVTTLAYDPDRGTLRPIQKTSTLPDAVRKGDSTAEIQFDPDGNFVYGSNRGRGTLAIFLVSPSNGTLVPMGHHPTGGKVPRGFGIDPSGRFLLAANQDANTVVSLRIKGGLLEETGHSVAVPTPVCVKFISPDAP